ncbi:hypothetical protein K470DRAFT_9699 [Piedraia hortae CBS 480.64]|uniref:Signal recognition particle subunit SRP72 n=1 Tax=Piedraia hortae CBS 480.64 TaxID=1314780 RepID=A0A6A7C5S0_9PEZI|nr:hypothetical protein K470DRAFT_9699 [Piedraia hortae CBS 480.64]
MSAELASLLKQTHITDHEEILHAANAKLKTSKNDVEALHIKVIALLKLDRYNDALHTFDSARNSLKDKAPLEYAYTLYKCGQPALAAEVAAKGSGMGCKHAEAQARYRLEEFQRAAELYAHLSENVEQDAETDLKVNAGAVDAQLKWVGSSTGKQKEGPESYETAFNRACQSLAQGRTEEAHKLVRRAGKMCSMLDDLTEQEKKAEMTPLIVQEMYIFEQSGQTEEASSLIQAVDEELIADRTTKLIAKTNKAAVSSDVNPYISERELSLSTKPGDSDSPFGFQNSYFEENKRAIALECMKYRGVADSTAAEIKKQHAPSLDPRINTIAVINAAAHARNESGKEALKTVMALFEKRPLDVGLALTIVQLHVLDGHTASAVPVFESFLERIEESGTDLDVRYAPGLVGTMVALYQATGSRKKSWAEMAKTVKFWRGHKDWSASVVKLLNVAGGTLLDSPEAAHQELARVVFDDLYRRDGTNLYTAAGYLATANEGKLSTQESPLRPVRELITGINIDRLESLGVSQPQTSISATKRPAMEETSKKPKKMRTSRLPKDYDPNKKPDPERWLPLRDRSTYRPKGKKGKARQAMLSQGATEGQSKQGGDVVKGKQGKKKGKR